MYLISRINSDTAYLVTPKVHSKVAEYYHCSKNYTKAIYASMDLHLEM